MSPDPGCATAAVNWFMLATAAATGRAVLQLQLTCADARYSCSYWARCATAAAYLC